MGFQNSATGLDLGFYAASFFDYVRVDDGRIVERIRQADVLGQCASSRAKRWVSPASAPCSGACDQEANGECGRRHARMENAAIRPTTRTVWPKSPALTGHLHGQHEQRVALVAGAGEDVQAAGQADHLVPPETGRPGRPRRGRPGVGLDS